LNVYPVSGQTTPIFKTYLEYFTDANPKSFRSDFANELVSFYKTQSKAEDRKWYILVEVTGEHVIHPHLFWVDKENAADLTAFDKALARNYHELLEKADIIEIPMPRTEQFFEVKYWSKNDPEVQDVQLFLHKDTVAFYKEKSKTGSGV
jgi:malate synthase